LSVTPAIGARIKAGSIVWEPIRIADNRRRAAASLSQPA
jgi:hypothetical protein